MGCHVPPAARQSTLQRSDPSKTFALTRKVPGTIDDDLGPYRALERFAQRLVAGCDLAVCTVTIR